MRRAQNPLPTFVTAAALLALAACATLSPPANPQSVVNERVTIMKNFVGALTASGQYTQGKGTAQDAKTKLAAARAGVDRLENLFPPGTALGDRGVTTSRALSTIFANRADFDAKRAKFGQVLAALDAAVGQNAKPETAKQITAVKSTCLACHAKYRTADE